MKIDSRGAPKPSFNPIEIVITLESREEMDAFKKACEQHERNLIIFDKGGYYDNKAISILTKFWETLKPHVTRL